MMDWDAFFEGIRDDGTIEGHQIETHYAPCTSVIVADGFLRIVADNGVTDVETRIPFSELKRMGFVPAAAEGGDTE